MTSQNPQSMFSEESVKRFKYFRQMQLYYEQEAKRLEQSIKELQEEDALARYILSHVPPSSST